MYGVILLLESGVGTSRTLGLGCDGMFARKCLWEPSLALVWAQVKDILPPKLWILLHEDMIFEALHSHSRNHEGAIWGQKPKQRMAEPKLERTMGTWWHEASDVIRPGTVPLSHLCEIINCPISKFLARFWWHGTHRKRKCLYGTLAQELCKSLY